MMLITMLLMIEDRRNISCANNACYVHISFLVCDENAWKTNSVIYFNRQWSEDQCGKNTLPIEMNGEELKNVDHFKYLGSVIDKDGTIDRDVDLRVQAAWSSWRKLTGVLYDRKFPLRLKAKIYETIIRPALTYGSECWAMKVTNKRKITTTEMRMLRGILGVSRRDHIRNEEIRRILHLSPIDEVMRSGRLRWFGHVQRRDATNVTRRVMELAIPGTRRRGRPKKTLHQQMKEDMAGVGVTQDVALDRKEWRRTRPTPTR